MAVGNAESHALCAVSTRSQLQGGSRPSASIPGAPSKTGSPEQLHSQPAARKKQNKQHIVPVTPAAPAQSPVQESAVYDASETTRLSWTPELQDAYRNDAALGEPANESVSTVNTQLHTKQGSFDVSSKNGLWYRGDCIVIPDCPAIWRQIMTELHDSKYAGHGGEVRTVQLLSRYFWWFSLDRDVHVKQFVKTVHSIRGTRHAQGGGELQQHTLPRTHWIQICMDHMSGLPESMHSNTMIIIVLDCFSKMAHFVPCKAASKAEDIANLYVQNIFLLHGWPRGIITDKDGRFLDSFRCSMCS